MIGRMIPRPERFGEEEEELSEEEDEKERGKLRRGVTDSDKRKINKLHANLGHPSREDFVRALRMARAREEVWRYAKDEFQCDICKAHQRPKANRPATIPRHYAPGRRVGVDVVYFPGVAPNETLPVLNMVDCSCYQMFTRPSVSRGGVWNRFMRSWRRTFGVLEISRVNEIGAVVKTIGARVPHQQGRTELHGGLTCS